MGIRGTCRTSCSRPSYHDPSCHNRFRTTTFPWTQSWSRTFHQQLAKSGRGSSSHRCSTMMGIHTCYTSCTPAGSHNIHYRTTTFPWSQSWSRTFHQQQPKSGMGSSSHRCSTMMGIHTCYTSCTRAGCHSIHCRTTTFPWSQSWSQTFHWQQARPGMGSSSCCSTMMGIRGTCRTSCSRPSYHDPSCHNRFRTTIFPWSQTCHLQMVVLGMGSSIHHSTKMDIHSTCHTSSTDVDSHNHMGTSICPWPWPQQLVERQPCRRTSH